MSVMKVFSKLSINTDDRATTRSFYKEDRMFKITIESERRLMLVETAGLGTVAEVAAFAKEEEAILSARGWRAGDFTMLMHTLDSMPQPQNVIQALQDHLHSNPRKPHRLAVVKSGAIAGMQTRRVLTSDNAAHFATIEEAKEWLDKCPPVTGFPNTNASGGPSSTS